MVRETERNLTKAASHVMQLLKIELSLSLHTPKQRLSLLFGGPNNPQKLPLSVGDLHPYMILLAHASLPSNWHPDQFSRCCRAHERDQQTDTQTDHATPSVAIGGCGCGLKVSFERRLK